MGNPSQQAAAIAKAQAEAALARIEMDKARARMDDDWRNAPSGFVNSPFGQELANERNDLDQDVDALDGAWVTVNSHTPNSPGLLNVPTLKIAKKLHDDARARIDKWLDRYQTLLLMWKAVRSVRMLPHPFLAGGSGLLPNGTILGGGTGVPSLGGFGSIGGSGPGFGGAGAGPNSLNFHGIPGMGGFGKRPGDDEGGLGAPGVHGSGFQGNYGNGFFGSGFLHPGVGLGGGLTGGGTAPSGGGRTGKHKTGSGTTGGSYVDSTSRNDARGSGSDRDRGGDQGGSGVDKGGGGGDTTSPRESGMAGMTEKTSGGSTPAGEPPAGSGSGSEQRTPKGDSGDLLRQKGYDDMDNQSRHRYGSGGSEAPDGGGDDTGGNASESRRTFTGYQPRNHESAVGAVTVGVGQHHLPGSPVSYITATSHVGSIGGTTEGFGGTQPQRAHLPPRSRGVRR